MIDTCSKQWKTLQVFCKRQIGILPLSFSSSLSFSLFWLNATVCSMFSWTLKTSWIRHQKDAKREDEKSWSSCLYSRHLKSSLILWQKPRCVPLIQRDKIEWRKITNSVWMSIKSSCWERCFYLATNALITPIWVVCFYRPSYFHLLFIETFAWFSSWLQCKRPS